MAAVSVCLAGSPRAAASDTGFTVRTKVAHAPARIDWSVVTAGEWDVTVGYDAARCEIYCAYRLKRDEFGRPRLSGLLAPPVAAIRIYRDAETAPEDIVVDPGGLEQPGISGHVAPAVESAYLPGTRLGDLGPDGGGGRVVPPPRPVRAVSDTAPCFIDTSANLPLRI